MHTPKLAEFSPWLGWYSRVDFLSMGTLSIAESLAREGLATRVVHVGVEKQLFPGFSLVDRVARSGAPLVAFALHWHPQTWDALEASRQLKAVHPEVFVVLGGLTASFFAEEILARYPWVDAVIRGEAERPMVQLTRAVRAGRVGLEAVENLLWRDGEQIRQNPRTYVSGPEDMDGWDFGAWDLVEHADLALRQLWRHLWDPRLRAALSPPAVPTLFGAALGRGCAGTCTWCAGSYGAMKDNTGRKRVAWRKAERVAATVTAARAAGAERIYTCFDPHPKRDDELLGILEALGDLAPRVALDFEFFGLPSDAVVDAFARHLDPSSTLIVSPETASEALRRRHRAFPFTNAALEATLARAAGHGLRADLYFILGLPGEDRGTVAETLRYQASLRQIPSVRRIYTWPLEMEPGAPWHREPERHGLTLRHRTVEDFRVNHGTGAFTLGYDTETLREAEILELYDRAFARPPEGLREQLGAYVAAHAQPPYFARDFGGLRR